MDVFSILGTGARFDRKRIAEVENLFKKERKQIKLDDSMNVSGVDFFAPNKPIIDTHHSEKSIQDAQVNDTKEDSNDFANVEELGRFKNAHKIRISGSDIPNPVKNFGQMMAKYEMDKELRNKIDGLEYRLPTPVQMQAIPVMLAGRDLIACAPTGSGKTISFVLPILHLLRDKSKEGIRALVISPTKELAQQIYREFMRLSPEYLNVAVFSKANYSDANASLDVLITTPLRLVYAIKEKKVSLETVKYMVIDEADKLFEMGFIEQIDEIMAACTNENIQKALFSATINGLVENLSNNIMKDPIRVTVGLKNTACDAIDQKLIFVGQEEGKIMAIRQLIQKGIKPPVLIFVESIERAKELFQELAFEGINVDVIHGDRSEAQREEIIKKFRLGYIWVLIATELLGRGLDFKGVELVINYDIPRTVESYIHRIGRTGRAGRKGEAITFFMKEDGQHLRKIAHIMKQSGCKVPEWMLTIKKERKWKGGDKNSKQLKNVGDKK